MRVPELVQPLEDLAEEVPPTGGIKLRPDIQGSGGRPGVFDRANGRAREQALHQLPEEVADFLVSNAPS